jgi:hypothetical protein
MLPWAGPDTALRCCASRFGGAGHIPSPDPLTTAVASPEVA